MALSPYRTEIDITIRKFGPKGQEQWYAGDKPIPELVLKEEATFKSMTLVAAIRKLVLLLHETP